jgi:uncharacterized protein YbjT (DUF2867 family)
MILVTGATGNIGRSLLSDLHRYATVPVRALTRDPARAAFPTGVEAAAGDLADPASVEPALTGVHALFLLAGYGAEADVLAAARAGTHPHLLPAAERLAVERVLKDSGLAWTILRPTQFTSNALWWADSIRTEGVVRVPYPDTGLPAVHPADVAAVARVALTESGHTGRTYELTGPERITPRQQVAELSAELGREIALVGADPREARRELAALMGEEGAAAVLALTGAEVTEELARVRDTVTRVTGAPARTFRAWVSEQRAAFG